MFTKHVWHDRRHQAEVFINEDGVVSGTIVSFKGAVSLINPRPEILSALYQEAKIKRILAIGAVIITDGTIEHTRGLCSLLSYSRGLRRRKPLQIITSSAMDLSFDFLNSCCMRLLGRDAKFDVEIRTLEGDARHQLGIGHVSFVPTTEDDEGTPPVEIRTSECVLRFYDESHNRARYGHGANEVERPHLVVRAAGMPEYSERRVGRLIDAG